ncbi:lanthionine synthetase C family protein [Actinoplanes missouriensis]|uniref:lanthionine synthetase C family protein n=1 Tax=Actinoplanes missouriensis TaxID=1866 RepID=UPI0033D3A830
MSATAVSITPTEDEVVAQSLASGAAGEALLAIERACGGTDTWDSARRSLADAVAGGVDAADHSGLFHGAPAIAFLLHQTIADGQQRYERTRNDLNQHVRQIARRRLHAAKDRIRSETAAAFAEYDVFYGLSGLAVVLLHSQPGCDELHGVLRYLVQLTEPFQRDGMTFPGWWVDHDPDPILPTPGGHANNGMAHGAAGILAVLAHATRRQILVDGQTEAINRLCGWFDRWRQDSVNGPWWPQWLTREQLRCGRPGDGPVRPSWCYGAAGIGRALQIAAIATSDQPRRRDAEATIAACLTDPQLDRFTEPGICHGLAGLYQTATRAAVDAANPRIGQRLSGLAQRLIGTEMPADRAFLTGRTGVALATEAIRTGNPSITRWDACLLIA